MQTTDYTNQVRENSFINELEIAYGEKKVRIDKRIKSSNNIVEILKNIFPVSRNYREYFFVVYFNRVNNPIGWQHVASGSISATIADTRIILTGALLSGAVSMILSHNHPSGDTTPSQADLDLTQKVKEAAQYMDIKVLDHIILGENSNYYSFADQNQI